MSTKEIFNNKMDLDSAFHNVENKPQDARYFDLERKQLLYGRIDREGDAVMLNDENLSEIYSGTNDTEFAVNFVAEAFNDLRRRIQGFTRANIIERDSPYNGSMKVYKAYRAGDVEYSYYHYINKLYANFVQEYLEIDRRFEKIKNFGDFVREFLIYAIRIAYDFPITKTGYILSHHCPPYVSGLAIEIQRQQHGIAFNQKVLDYLDDPNFVFFMSEARKFGFMIDKNAPWRLVFNIASKAGGIGGRQFDVDMFNITEEMEQEILNGRLRYLERHGVNFENVFDVFYQKAHLVEIQNLKRYMSSLYDAFYKQFSTFVKLEYPSQVHHECNKLRMELKYIDRTPLTEIDRARLLGLDKEDLPITVEDRPWEDVLTDEFTKTFNDEYWLKIILKLRLTESSVYHDLESFYNHIRKTIEYKRVLGTRAALNHINNLTKGFERTKFIREGKYWYGVPEKTFEERLSQAEVNRYSPDRVDVELQGSLNRPEE